MSYRLLFPVIALLAACGSDLDALEASLEATLKELREAAAVLGTIKDKASAETARPKIEELVKRHDENVQAWNRLPANLRSGPPPDTPRFRRLGSQTADAANELLYAMERVERVTQKDPEVRQILISAGVEKLVGRNPK